MPDIDDNMLYGAPDLVLTRDDWKEAYMVQDACNLSGVVHSFSRMMSKIWDEANARGGCGTSWVNGHPIAVLFADKIAHLTDTQYDGRFDIVGSAYGHYWDKIKE